MVDLIFTSRNRLEFTRLTLETLHQNTDWGLVQSAKIWDDQSTDGTLEHVISHREHFSVVTGDLRSSVAALRMTVSDGRSKYLAKIDSDTMAPPGWLNACVEVMERNPELDLLGIEAMRPVVPGIAARGYDPAPHIGGIGLFRREAFERCGLPDVQASRYNGFTEWQHEHEAAGRLWPGWLNPALPVCLLDHVPLEPWASLSEQYIAKGWQRRTWGHYTPEQEALWSWWAR